MKKTTLKKGSIITSTICVIAILISLIYQFVPCWSYSGIIKNDESGEKRAKNMEISLAGFVWLPKSTESLAFVEYLKDPTLNYAEKYTETASVNEYTEEKYEELLAEQERHAEIIAKAEETADETVVEEETATEVPAEAIEVPADATEAPVEVTESPKEEYKDATYTYIVSTASSTTEIIEHHKDITDESYNTVISSSKNNAAKIQKYTEYSNAIKSDYVEFINTMILLPILILFAEALSIFLIIFFARKGVGKFIGSVCTVIVGALNIVHLFTQPIYLLSQANMYITMIVVFGVVTLIGLILLCKDIVAVTKKEEVID